MCYPNNYPTDDYADYILKSYEFKADEYPTAYAFGQILKNSRPTPYFEFSSISDDFYFNSKGIITSCWTIFFTCIPKEAEKLRHVIKHISGWSFIKEVDYDDFLFLGKEQI